MLIDLGQINGFSHAQVYCSDLTTMHAIQPINAGRRLSIIYSVNVWR